MPRPTEAVTIGDFDLLRPGIAGVHASTISGLAGWWTVPEARSDDQARSTGDGDFPSIRTLGPRLVTISGDVSARTRDALFRFRDRLASLAVSGPELLTVTGHGPSQQARVYRDAGMEWSEKSPLAATWQLPLKAPDPRKFGLREHRVQSTSGASVEVYHEGNYPALPVLNVYSANFPEGYTVYCANGIDPLQSTRIPRSLTSGMVHTVDFATGVSAVQGETESGMIARARIVRIDPYRTTTLNVLPYNAPGEPATVAWYWHDTWI